MNKIARVLLGFAAAVLTFTVAAVVQAGDDPPAAPGSGMRIYLDEQGRPIAPPPEAPAAEPPPTHLTAWPETHRSRAGSSAISHLRSRGACGRERSRAPRTSRSTPRWTRSVALRRVPSSASGTPRRFT